MQLTDYRYISGITLALFLGGCATQGGTTATADSSDSAPAATEQQASGGTPTPPPAAPKSAKADTQDQAAATKTAQADDAKAKSEPEGARVAGMNVQALAKKVRNNHFTHFHRTNNTYTLYIGGEFLATYYPDDQKLTVREDNATGENKTCTVNLASTEGKLDEVCGTLLSTVQQEVGETSFAGN
mgnify:CR=1 FL=1